MMLILRLFYIQIAQGDFFAQSAFLQKTGDMAEKVRGGIYDTNGESLTGNYTASFAVISPNWLSLEEKQLLVENNILDSIEDSNVENIPVTPENSKILYSLINKTPGLVIYEKDVRYGPEALATHVVGFQGQTGIEKAFNSFLESNIKNYYVINDGLGQPIVGISLAQNKNKVKPWGVKLTIDKDIQKIVEDIMDKRIEAGAVVVINAKSGEILAMASRPN